METGIATVIVFGVLVGAAILFLLGNALEVQVQIDVLKARIARLEE